MAAIACGAQPNDGCARLLEDASPTELRKGSEIWSVLCVGCHGESGRGGASAWLQEIAPPDLTDPYRAALFCGKARRRIIAEGVAGTTMVGWKTVLTETEILAVNRHLCTLIHDEREGSGE